ncbi:hypothetical protein Vi05172_g10211 [Venturia inaequalis]|nr:hypothetical protein Vi05172_g10211 [Venturia inaequalis]
MSPAKNSRRDESQVEKEARPKTQAKEKKDQSEIQVNVSHLEPNLSSPPSHDNATLKHNHTRQTHHHLISHTPLSTHQFAKSMHRRPTTHTQTTSQQPCSFELKDGFGIMGEICSRLTHRGSTQEFTTHTTHMMGRTCF